MFYLGKEQSNTFDALVACSILVMIRYLILVYILGKRRWEVLFHFLLYGLFLLHFLSFLFGLKSSGRRVG